MRTTKELLKVVLNNINMITGGLCGIVNELYNIDIISFEESKKLLEYIKDNRPQKGSRLYQYRSPITIAWYWTICAKEPRIRWLKYHIRICKE